MLELVLASQSPRRRELLEGAGYQFRVSHVEVSENIDVNLNPGTNASRLAFKKATACLNSANDLNSNGFLIIAADTIVALGDRAFGKPGTFSEACETLRLLSGKTHSVITGLCLIESGSMKSWEGFEETRVTFRALSEGEIHDYILSGEPMDKAGAYAIQGAGGKFVSSYSGSWSNVVGLPLEMLEKVLQENGWNVRRRSS
jgi:septum formation protein